MDFPGISSDIVSTNGMIQSQLPRIFRISNFGVELVLLYFFPNICCTLVTLSSKDCTLSVLEETISNGKWITPRRARCIEKNKKKKKTNSPRPNPNISMNPNNPLLMKNRMRLSDNLMNPVPRSFYKETKSLVNIELGSHRPVSFQLSALGSRLSPYLLLSCDFSFSCRDRYSREERNEFHLDRKWNRKWKWNCRCGRGIILE